MNRQRIRVLLVHDYELARQGLRRMLEEYEDVDVVGDTGNASEALNQVATVSPDVILLDAQMPNISGLEVMRLLKDKAFSGVVIVMSVDAQRLADALNLGAGGYLVQDAQADEVVSAIRRAPEGGFVFGASLMKTAHGQEIALRYLAGLETKTTQVLPEGTVSTTVGPVQSAAAEQAVDELVKDTSETPFSVVEQAPSLPTVAPDALVPDVELVFTPPIEPSMVLNCITG